MINRYEHYNAVAIVRDSLLCQRQLIIPYSLTGGDAQIFSAQEICAFDQVKHIFTDNNATHTAVTIVTGEIFIAIGMRMNTVVGVNIAVLIETDEATARAIGDAISFDMMRLCNPIFCRCCRVIREADVVHRAALSGDKFKGKVLSRWMQKVSDIVFGIDNELIADTRLPSGECPGGGQIFGRSREAQHKAKQGDGKLLNQSNTFYILNGLRQCSAM